MEGKIIKKEYKVVVTDETEHGLKNFVSVYTTDDKYIGGIDDLNYLLDRGIYDIQTFGDCKCCAIGFNEDEQKWYGWSHRAICGFGIGHIVKEGNCEASSGENLKEYPDGSIEDVGIPVGFECRTVEDCKRCAIAFAESVS